MRTLSIIIAIVMIFSLSSCTNSNVSKEEKIWQQYADNNRLDIYNKLVEKYGENHWILNNNKESDSYWLTNTTIWIITLIAPDTAAFLTLAGFIQLVLILTGTSLTGGMILHILARVGNATPFIFIPASVAGVFVIGVFLVIIHRFLTWAFGWLL